MKADSKTSFVDFLKSADGSLAPMAAMIIIIMTFMIGGFVDFGIASIVRSKISAAVDAATLAAAIAPTDQDKKAVAQRYYELNYPGIFMGASMPFSSLTFNYDPKNSQVELKNPDSTFNTYFLKVGNIDSLPIATGSVAQSISSNSTMQDEDYVLVLDVSGSMSTQDMQNGTKTRLQAMKEATLGLITKLLPYPPTDPNFNPNVRVGLSEFDKILELKVALTSNNKTINDTLNALAHGSGTCGACGLIGAKDLFSSKPYPQTARTDGQPYSTIKAIVLLTDGEFNENYSTTMGSVENEARIICNDLKASNITIYTIGFSADLTSNTKAQNILSNCASTGSDGKPLFYLAPDLIDLVSIYQIIVQLSSKARIVR